MLNRVRTSIANWLLPSNELAASRAVNKELVKYAYHDGNSFVGRTPKRMSDLIYRMTAPGIPGVWTDNRIEQSRHFKRWVYTAINSIAQYVADQPVCLGYVERKREGSKKAFVKAAGRMLRPYEEIDPVEEDHDLLEVLEDPNDCDSIEDIYYETVMFLLLTGNAYWWIVDDDEGLPSEIWVLPSHWVWAIPGRERLVESYEVRPVEGGYLNWSFDASEIIHFKFKSPISKIDGWSPLTAGAQWIDCSESVDTSRWHQFANGPQPSIIFKLPEEFQDPSDEDMRRIEAKMINKLVGPQKAGKVLFLTPGAEAVPWSMSPREMDYFQSAEQMRDYVLSGVFRVPPVISGIAADHTYDNIWGSMFSFWEFVLNPLYRCIDRPATRHLARRYDNRLCIYHENKAPPDPQQRNRDWELGSRIGAVAPNEYRVNILGLEPWESEAADNPFIPLGTAPFPMVAHTDSIGGIAREFLNSDVVPDDGQHLEDDDDTGDEDSTGDVAGTGATANELRASVGGSQSLLQLQQAVYNGEIPREAAVVNARLLFGFSEAEAESLFPEIKPQKTAEKETVQRNGVNGAV